MSYLWRFRWGGLMPILLLLGCAASSASPSAHINATDTSNQDIVEISNTMVPTVTETSQEQTCVPAISTATQRAAPKAQGVGFPEIEGEAYDIEVWALLFKPPENLQDSYKMVWRVTGTGEFTVTATHTDGTTITPTDITPHPESNWKRPGDEWGTIWEFPSTGCWTFEARRDEGYGVVMLEVAFPPV